MSIFPVNRTLFFGYQSDSQAVFRSDDGCKSWKKLFTIHDSIRHLNGFKMWNPSSGFLLYNDVHWKYHDLVTHDGGNSFTDLRHDSLFQIVANNDTINQNYNTFSMSWLDSLNGLLYVPVPSGSNNTLLVTHNGAMDWQFAHVFAPSGDTTVRLNNNTGRGYMDTYGLTDIAPKPYFYYSTDYGDHWLTSDTTTMPTNLGYFCIQTARTTFWSMALQTKISSSSAPKNLLLYTNDLGKHWNADFVTFKDYNIDYMGFADSLHGYAGGMKIGQTGDSQYFFKFIAGSSDVADGGNPTDASSLEIYPNPCGNIIHLRTSKSFTTFRIINLLG